MARAHRPRFKSRRTLAPQPAPPGLYESTYDVALGAAICRRIAAGESLRSICRADAAMPTEKTVWNWARAHPEFRAMKDHAFAVARSASLAARDAAELDRQLAFGGRYGRSGRPSGYSLELAEAILERLVMGEALADICRDRRMPSVGTVYNWLKKEPWFLEQYRLMKTGLEGVLAEIACERLAQPERERDFGPLIRRTVRAAERRARRLSLKRYAPSARTHGVRVIVSDAEGQARVVYDGPPLDVRPRPPESR
jgi:hypothetical protein